MALKKGSNGDEVKVLQKKLQGLGYPIDQDGDFGRLTHWAVTNFQAMFGYDIDGIAGPATVKLIDAQVGYNWNAGGEGHLESALRAQGLKA